MKPMLANDLVIREENCNLSCKYCLTGQSQFKQGHLDQLIFQPPRPHDYSVGSDLAKRVDAVVASSGTALGLPIIKVTGGEIFLVRGIMDLLRRLKDRFATVVIQTNAVLLTPEILGEIKSWGNACLQISLDAVSYAGNSYRSETEDQHQKIMTRIFRALDAGIPTEIYCVLNDRSLPEFEETLSQLMRFKDHVVVCPFPVRGPDRNQFYPKAGQERVLTRIMDSWEKFSEILPPKAYLARLIRFFKDGERQFRCHLPRFAFTSFDDGHLTSCPNIWFNKLGNVLEGDPSNATGNLGETPFYELLLAEKPRVDACKRCFTPWDMLSMYMDKEITLDELCQSPMYSAPESRVRIQEIANAYWGGKC
jgi:MoaA/NifB/PqqE/SkfB family radical SAM enzyme